MAFNIVLVEPEIPQNTGNIARTCAATGSTLHLVRPLGFTVDDRRLKRAGLDYWHLVDIRYYDSFDELRKAYHRSRFYFATTKGRRFYDGVRYRPGDFLVFGKETGGLPREILEQNFESCIRIPMVKETAARSLNLSNSVAVILYEALRQQGFTELT
ncbi:MAG: tRNA (uridine(34)/cytosine(34)/5-carboxymethylaminomethyluridine(34)-2'-O)-methyltransferase TrmL [Clostridiales bacterium]|jgi:tRNA (cytidine/uridine-2'-O-)-methyltransferase|nr:tRNA (uridine(34)/cytosine(34)/5-carboxymethylaminomethyluridine(34)-2'-O)-methyltransferase TrmL [Clostridiales bacterium]